MEAAWGRLEPRAPMPPAGWLKSTPPGPVVPVGTHAASPRSFCALTTFATRYLNANPGDPRGLAQLLGHHSLATVMIYTEPTLQELTARMERVDVAEGPPQA